MIVWLTLLGVRAVLSQPLVEAKVVVVVSLIPTAKVGAVVVSPKTKYARTFIEDDSLPVLSKYVAGMAQNGYPPMRDASVVNVLRAVPAIEAL